MTENMTSCPTTEELQRLLDESLSGDQQALLQSHIDGCVACQKVLESLVAGGESWDEAAMHLRAGSSGPMEPVLSEAVRRIKDDEFAAAHRPTNDPAQLVDFLQPSDQPGSLGRLGMYEVSAVVGQGGMGIVVKAFDPALHRVVAVKVLAPYLAHNPQARKRFVREAQAIAAVSHDHVITIHAIDESEEQPKIVMQFIAGQSLQQKLDLEGSLDLKEILRIGVQTAAGLAAAHAQGLVHRDVKPSNILLENGVQRVKLTDFGLARAVDDASLTQSGVIAGTPQYMAPEQANGDAVDYRADLFSLGSVMYAMCVGHSPFRASTTMGVLKRVCHDPPRPIQELNPDIPAWLCDIVMKLLAKSPTDRFQSARQVAELLEKWLAHIQQPMAVPPPGPTSPTPSPTPRPAANPAVPPKPVVQDWNQQARTIFFQSISGRQVLFLWLAGVAGTIAFNPSMGRPVRMNLPELVLVSGMMGLMVAFWGTLFIALIRFLWANVMVFAAGPAIAERPRSVPPDSSAASPAGSPTTIRGLPPESLAMLAGIGTLLVSNVVFAAIVTIVVWRVLVARSPSHAGPVETDSGLDRVDVAAVSGVPLQTVLPDLRSVLRRLVDLPRTYWKQADFAKLLNGSIVRSAVRSLGTFASLCAWTVACGAFTVIVVLLYVLFGPSNYTLEDRSAVRVALQGHEFTIIARGSGSATGMLLPDSVYRPDSITVTDRVHRTYMNIKLGSPSQVYFVRRSEVLSEAVVADYLKELTGSPQPSHAKNLYQAIERQGYYDAEAPATGPNLSFARRMQAVLWEMNDHPGPYRRLNGYTTMADALDPALFQVTPVNNDSAVKHTCKPVISLVAALLGGLMLLWLAGIGRIVVNHRRTAA
ncbi:MAG: serine/threonine protein kinase [Planctomycetes bacterium]|nr:serine/threonine protein kinase [Planctomycetota bacterium]